MKNLRKSLLVFAFLLCMIMMCFGIFTACNDNPKGEEISYSVTVEYPDGSGVKNVTVSFSLDGKDYGSAVTDETGKAEKSLSAAAYDVTLSDLPEGYEFTESVKTDRKGNPLSVTLVQKTLTYSVTVTLPGGATAGVSGITVTWRNGKTDAGTAVTNESGVATATLPAGNYTVLLSDEPEGYWLETALTASAANSAVTAALTVDTRIEFTVNARTEGGMNVRNVRFFVLKGTETVYEGTTDKDGTASFRLLPDNYTLLTTTSIAGLTPEKTSYSLNAENSSVVIQFTSAIIEDSVPDRKTYVLGDIMYDFTVTTYNNGQTLTLSELLETKKAVVLNFWFTNCTYCVQEFPCLETAYEDFKDDIEVIAFNPFEDSITIANFLNSYASAGTFNLTFPVVRDAAGLFTHFNILGYPTTVIIDRYGAVAFIEAGGIVETELWTQLFTQYTADDYTQKFTPGEEISPPEEFIPDEVTETMPASSEIEAAINADGCSFTYRAEIGTADAEYSWPWIIGEKNGDTAIKPSNSGHRSSYAILHVDMELEADDVVAFDFFSSTESSDIVYVLVDGLVIWQISGLATKWQTCFAYVPLKAGAYTMTLIYQKDATQNSDEDAVFIKNMRIVTKSDITGEVDILRQCATEPNEDLTQYNDYVTPVMGADGYYHVGKADGPYILADLLHGTNWNNTSFFSLVYKASQEEKVFMYDLDGDGVKENCTDLINDYLNLATKSDSYGLVPVDAMHKTLLDCITAEYSENHHEEEWLELCKYYSHYGTPGERPFPTLGLREDMAFTAVEGTNMFTLNRPLYPVGMLIYKFVPTKTGVYRFHSNATNEHYQTQAWLYGSAGTIEGEELAYNGNDLLGTTPDDDGINFSIYANLTAGETYYFQCAFYWGNMLGSFDFDIEYKGTYVSVLTNCAPGYFDSTLDENGNMTGKLYLNGIETELYQGKYYAKNADGSRGSVILIDFKQPTRGHSGSSLEQIIKSWIYDTKKENQFHPFDFTKALVEVLDENGELIDDGTGKPKVEVVENEGGVDYTEKMLEYLALADENGYVEATEELVEILQMYNALFGFNVDNEWLQFAYYYKEYGVKPVTPQPEAILPGEQE